MWWTTVPNLTPVAAWDATRVAGAQLLDGVGDNHITATSEIVAHKYWLRGVSGDSNPMALTTPIPIPANGVVAGFFTPRRSTVLLARGSNDTAAYALHVTPVGNWHASNHGSGGHYGSNGGMGSSMFAAMVCVADSHSYLYVNGTLVGQISSWYTMSQIGQIGYAENGNEHNLDADEHFHALGVWTGAATQADVKALEAAARAELRGEDATFRSIASGLGRMTFPIPQHLLLSPIPPRFVGSTLTRRDYLFGGNGRIEGSIKVKGVPDKPFQRRVQLYDESSKTMTREVWSDQTTGAYLFENIDPKLTYSIISYDYQGAYRAVIASGIKANT